MKKEIISFLFWGLSLFVPCLAQSVDLTVLPKTERNAMLVKIVQDFLWEKYPMGYSMKNVIFTTISQGNYVPALKWTWTHDRQDTGWRLNYPDYLNPEDKWYKVKLYYTNVEWDGRMYRDTCCIETEIIGKTGEIREMYHTWWDQRTTLYRWHDTKLIEKEPLSKLPQAERDSILIAIAKEAFQKEYPHVFRDNLHAVITTGDFSGLRKAEYGDNVGIGYVNPEDIWYNVILYYKDWKKEPEIFREPCIGSVDILEKTREAYRVSCDLFPVNIK